LGVSVVNVSSRSITDFLSPKNVIAPADQRCVVGASPLTELVSRHETASAHRALEALNVVDAPPGSHHQVLLVVVLVQILVQVLLVVMVDKLPGSHHQVVLAERDPALGTTRAEQSDTP